MARARILPRRPLGAVALVVAALLVTAGVPGRSLPASAAAIFQDGFESGSLSSWSSSSGLIVQTQQVFAGTYAARSTSSTAWASRTFASPRADVTVGYEAKFIARSSAVTLLRLKPASAPWILQLQVNSAGMLAYTNNVAGVTRTSAQSLTTGQWHAIEVHVTVAGSSSTVSVALDGSAVSGLVRTENLGSSPIGSFELGNRPTNRSYDLAVDQVTASSDSSGSSCPTDWSLVAAPKTLHALNGVSARADDDAWAVGLLKGQQSAPATIHWDGSTWQSFTPAPVGDFRSAFNAVDVVGSQDVWAVGYLLSPGESSTKAYRTVIQHWAGSGWANVSAPNQGTGSNSLVDVDGRTSNDAWAVGYWMDGNIKKTLAMHWTGSAWQIVPTPSPGATTNALTSVITVAADDAWAVGYRGSGQGYTPLILHWDGTAWGIEGTSSLAHGDETVLTGVAAAGPGDVWAVGYTVGAVGFRPVSGHLVSGTWHDVATDDPGGAIEIPQDVAVGSDGSVWTAGVHQGNQPDSETTLLQRWSQGSWATVASPNPSQTDNALFGIAGAPGTDRLWAVGRASADAVIMTACPATTVAAASTSGSTSAGSVSSTSLVAPSTVAATVPTAVSASASAIDVVASDVAAQAGLRFQMRSFPPEVFDYNNDGRPDVFMNHHYDLGSGIYRNRGDGTFELVQAFARVDRHGCDSGDVDGDGNPDLYCTTGANYGTDAKANELWLHTGSGWVERAVAERVGDPFGRGRWAVLFDADHDGHLDLYVGNLRERGDGLPSHNQFWLGTGSSFVPAPTFGLNSELRVGCARATDFNGDGFQDLLICTNAGPALFRNDGGSGFTNVVAAIAPNLKGSDGTFADMNGDGLPDLAMVQNGTVQVWLQTLSGSYVKKATVQVAGAERIAAGDVNADGLPDLYVLRGATSSSTNAPDQMLLNTGAGLTYSSMVMPGDPGGFAESVTPIDYDGNGLMDFLVMNGSGTTPTVGYSQLIAFFPK